MRLLSAAVAVVGRRRPGLVVHLDVVQVDEALALVGALVEHDLEAGDDLARRERRRRERVLGPARLAAGRVRGGGTAEEVRVAVAAAVYGVDVPARCARAAVAVVTVLPREPGDGLARDA